MHDLIRTFIKQRFRGAGDLKNDSPLFSSGVIDSFGVLELIAFLEDQFQVTIDPARHELEEFDTIDKIANVVSKARAADPSR